jgi:hypothetical protein
MRSWFTAVAVTLAVCAWASAATARAASEGTKCSAAGASTWTPPINVSNIRPTAISFAATLTCRGGGVLVGAMAGFLRSPKVACVAPPATTPEGGVLTIQWNTGRSSKISVKVTSVNSTGRQISSGRVTAGLFKGEHVKIDLQAKTAVGKCSDAAPLVSNTWVASVTL